MTFILTDISSEENKIVLYGEKENGEKIVITDDKFKPYFYTKTKPEITDEIISAEKEGNKYKVTIKNKEKLKEISQELNGTETDIPYTQRYLLDKKLVITKGATEELTPCEEEWNPTIIAIDIETTNKKGTPDFKEDDILMISLWSNTGTKKVLVSKPCKEENAEGHANEKAMLEALNKELSKKYSIIVTYNGDGFDWPFIREKMNKHKLEMNYGYNNERMTVINKNTSSTARIKGTSHVDLYQFVAKILSPQLKTSTLDLDSVSNELIGTGKEESDWKEFYKDWENNKMKKIIQYSLTDARITYELFNKLKPLIIELTRLNNQPIYETTRSSYSALVENYLINKTKEIPKRPDNDEVMKRMRNTFTGGYVHEPKPGLHDNIAVMDFRSLYPSIIVSYNIGPDTINKKGQTITTPEGTVNVSKETGFIPSVIKELVNTRQEIKKELKNKKNAILESRSYALKTITNAMYGYLTYPRSRWYSLECGKLITALGRKHVKEVITKAEENHFEVIYGDTDSAFIKIGNKTTDELNKFLNQVNKELPGIMELELERICKRGIFVTGKDEKGVKKRYALLDENNDLIIKGFEFVRGDWSQISKKTQYKIFMHLLKDNSKEKAINEVKKVINDLRNNKVPIKDLIIKTQMTRNIKDYKTINPHVQIAKKMESKGISVSAGTMIEYVVAEGKGLIRDKAKLPEEINEQVKPDAEYYINHQVLPAVERVLDAININANELEGKQQKGLRDYL